MERAGLRSEPGAYLDDAPLEVLELNNTLSLFGLHRRLRGAAVGHLAAFEATSSAPSRRMAQAFGRLGLGQELVDYYTEHVAADAVHDQIAVRLICGALVEDEPQLLGDVFFGAFMRPRPRGPLRHADAGPVGGRVSTEPTFEHADVIVCPAGPLLVRGVRTVRAADGTTHLTDRPVVALCRCTKSGTLPFCDGTHQLLPAALRP